MLLRGLLIAIFCLLLSYCKLIGQSKEKTTDSTTLRLPELVVSAKAKNQLHQVYVTEQLNANTQNVQEALDKIPGFFKAQSNNFSLVYRGQHGNRLRIEQNGSRRTGVTQSGGYWAEDINPGNVSTLQIINGVEKVIYGSGASGGVIDIQEHNGLNAPSSQLHSTFSTNDGGYVLGGRFSLSNNDQGVLVSVRRTESGNYRIPGGTVLPNSSFEQQTIGVSASRRLSNLNGQLDIIQKFSNGTWRRPQGFQNNPNEFRSFRNKYNHQTDVRLLLQKGKASIEQKASLLLLHTEQLQRSFNATFDDINLERVRSYDKKTINYRLQVHHSGNSNLSYESGTDFYYSNLEELLSENDFLSQRFSEGSFVARRIELQGGLFSRASYQLGNWRLKGALRLDAARIGDQDGLETFSAITGGLEVLKNFNKAFHTSLSAGRYFRYPAQREATGVVFGGRGTFFGNPDIRPELSYQSEWSAKGKISQWQYQVTTWYAFFKDRISETPQGDGTFTYLNNEAAQTLGIDWTLSYLFHRNLPKSEWEIHSSGSFLRGINLDQPTLFSQGAPLLGIPPGRVSLAIDYKRLISEKNTFSYSVTLDRVFALKRIPSGFISQTFGVVQAQPYWLLKLRLGVDQLIRGKQVKFKLEINNLTNSTYFPFGIRIAERGKDFRFSIVYVL